MMLYFFFLAKFILWCFSIFAASVNGIFFFLSAGSMTGTKAVDLYLLVLLSDSLLHFPQFLVY